MIAIVDSGSTKADWVFIPGQGGEIHLQTRGINPFLHSPGLIEEMLREDLGHRLPTIGLVEKVYFYGAGCSDAKRCENMSEGLSRIFTQATMYVEHDLLAAARATCLMEPGIACILGTGSNSCQYDGRQIIDNITSLGYLVGDEGSGSHIGKELLRAYYYREMPESLATAFLKEVAEDKTEVMDQIYGPKPNVYLASLSRFALRHLHEPYTRELVASCFVSFLERHVAKYQGAKHLPVHFVGSIAWHFREVLEEVLSTKGYQKGRWIQQPVRELVTYHLLTR